MSDRVAYGPVPQKGAINVSIKETDISNFEPLSPSLPTGSGSTDRIPERFRATPWLGLAALSVSFLTTLAALALLLWIQWRRELVHTGGIWQFLQPTSLMSIFVSINAAALHFALFEGLTVAWWVRASRPDTTIAQLHHIWQNGTSTMSALFQWRHRSLVSVATLFVATLPLNAFLLLGSITVVPGVVSRNDTIPVPIVRELRPGYSGYFNGGDRPWGTLDAWSNWSNWRQVVQQVKNMAGSTYAAYAYPGAYDQCNDGQTRCQDVFWNSTFTQYPPDDHLLSTKYYFNDTLSTFLFTAEGTGFEMNCTDSTVEQNYMPTTDNPTQAGPLFYTELSWDYANPNTLSMDMSWKQFGECSGLLNKTHCELTAAVVEYPVEMRLDLAGDYRGPYFSLPINTTWRDDSMQRRLLPYADEQFTSNSNQTRTRYGGIAKLLSDWLYANMTIESYYQAGRKPTDRLFIDGPLGYIFAPAIWDSANNDLGCNFDMKTGLAYNTYFQDMDKGGYKGYIEMGSLDTAENQISSPVDLVLNQIRQAMFLASVYEGAGWWSYSYASHIDTEGYFNRTGPEGDSIQYVNALLSKRVPTYRIRWKFWIASAALTYAVIVAILPTFWNFWSLNRRLTMSPVDVSRAIGVRLADNADQTRLSIDDLLNQIGHRRLQELRR